MVKKFDKVFYRNAGTPITTIAFSGATPSGWTALPANALVETSKVEMDKDVSTELADGTTYVGSDKGDAEIGLVNYAAGDYATIRTAFLNKAVDLLLIDSDDKAPGYCLWGARLYPKLTAGDGEPKIVLSGDKKRGAGAATTPLTIIAVT